MAKPPLRNPAFRPISSEDLPECLRPLASHIYFKAPYIPGLPGQEMTSAIELYFDLTSDDMSEQEKLYWQTILDCNSDLHLVSVEHRSQFENRKAVFEQLNLRLRKAGVSP